MKSFKELMTEKTNDILVGKDLDNLIKKSWEKYFKNTFVSTGKTALSGDEYNIYKFRFGEKSSEYANGIMENDPLSLSLGISVNDAGYIVEFNAKSITIKPNKRYMAYSSHVLKLRKFRAKTSKDLSKKLQTAFNKIHTDTKKLLKDGELDIHGPDTVKMINKKIK